MARTIHPEEEVQKRIDALPEAAANFLYSAEMSEAIKEIADKHKLHIDQMSLLEAEAGELMLGLTEPQDFAAYLTESLNITTEQAAAIAKDINEQVMSKIRSSMGQPSGMAPASSMPGTPVITHQSAVMPSSSVPAPAAPVPPAPHVVVPTPPVASASAPLAPKPAAVPSLEAADAMLSEKKVTPPVAAAPAPAAPAAPATTAANPVPKVDPAQPQDYKADPYREPVE